MRDMHGATNFDFIPRSYSLPTEYETFKKEATKTNKNKDPNVWIVKPINLSRGRGIFVTNNINEVPEEQEAVVQRYY
jgi:tubulin polyglutamylase TTLL2